MNGDLQVVSTVRLAMSVDEAKDLLSGLITLKEGYSDNIHHITSVSSLIDLLSNVINANHISSIREPLREPFEPSRPLGDGYSG